MHHLIVGALNACASLVKRNNMVPCFLGHSEQSEMCNVSGWNCVLDDEEGILIELMIRGFSRGKVAWVMRIETFFNDSLKVSVHMI